MANLDVQHLAWTGADTHSDSFPVSDSQEFLPNSLKGVNTMKGISYCGTVAGFRQYGLREILKCGFMGMTIAHDASRIQRRLNKAAAQDMTRRIVMQAMKGGIA